MSVKRKHKETNTSYFITFTSVKWMQIIAISEAYEAFYKWFDYLTTINVKTISYVIMPNHFYAVFHVPDNCTKTINQIVGNGKIFIAYDMVKRLI